MEKEKFKILWGGSKCFECGELFPTEDLTKKANAHESEFPGFRRATATCPDHNYGMTVVFERDCEF